LGVPVLNIMSISGHKTKKSFSTYIKASGEEHAKIMKNRWENNIEMDKPMIHPLLLK